MATKATVKNRIQKILSENSTGIYSDSYWQQVQKIFHLVEAIADFQLTDAKYASDGMTKTWRYKVASEGYVFDGVLNAHAAGSVKDPFDRYDISAYIF